MVGEQLWVTLSHSSAGGKVILFGFTIAIQTKYKCFQADFIAAQIFFSNQLEVIKQQQGPAEGKVLQISSWLV